MVREYGLDLTTLLDEPKNFSQTPIFSACVVKGEENSLKMVQVLIDLGCDPNKEDDLKQIPLFYAAREGYNKVVNLLISHGADVNRSDKYGQTSIFYCIREGHMETTQLLASRGAQHDFVDHKLQRPIYYAIQNERYNVIEWLLEKGVDLKTEDKKRMTPTHWAKRHNKQQILELLLQNEGVPLDTKKNPQKNQIARKNTNKAEEPRPKLNPYKVQKRFLLTFQRDDGSYEPCNDEEFEKFKKENPTIARYLEVREDGEDVMPLSNLQVPELPESTVIFDQWEKAAARCLQTLGRQAEAYIFSEPVNAEKLNLVDYHTIVKKPMDFGTIKTKLKEGKYSKIQEFMEDMDQVFINCTLYNGHESEVGKIGIRVKDEYERNCENLCFNFYMDPSE